MFIEKNLQQISLHFPCLSQPMEPEDMSMPSRTSETKLLRYIQSIRYASTIPVETPSHKTGPWSNEGAWPKKATFGEVVVGRGEKTTYGSR